MVITKITEIAINGDSNIIGIMMRNIIKRC